MHAALTYLSKLPQDTVVYNGHEYTSGSAKFGQSVEPDNKDINRLLDLVKTSNGCTAGKSTIADELKWNVFMRLDQPVIQSVFTLVACCARIQRYSPIYSLSQEGD